MADLPGYVRACLHTGQLAFLAILVSGGIVLQILVSSAFPCFFSDEVKLKMFVFVLSQSCPISHFSCLFCRHVLCTITGGQC